MSRFRRRGTNWEGRPWAVTAPVGLLADEIEQAWPNGHAADGTVAGKRHDEVSPRSDHRPTPWEGFGWVRALDAGENTEGEGERLAETLRASRDRRVLYVIHERRLFSSYDHADGPAWSWRPYGGGSEHLDHVHVSVTKTSDDDKRPWQLGLTEEDETLMITRKFTETDWRTLYQAGIVKGSSEDAVVEYWVRDAANRSDAEHRDASTSVAAEAIRKVGQLGGLPDLGAVATEIGRRIVNG